MVTIQLVDFQDTTRRVRGRVVESSCWIMVCGNWSWRPQESGPELQSSRKKRNRDGIYVGHWNLHNVVDVPILKLVTIPRKFELVKRQDRKLTIKCK